jgi:hypothetical protein
VNLTPEQQAFIDRLSPPTRQSGRQAFVAALARYTPRAIVDFNYRTDTITVAVPMDSLRVVAREMPYQKQMGIVLVVKKMTLWQHFTVLDYVDLNGDLV